MHSQEINESPAQSIPELSPTAALGKKLTLSQPKPGEQDRLCLQFIPLKCQAEAFAWIQVQPVLGARWGIPKPQINHRWK